VLQEVLMDGIAQTSSFKRDAYFSLAASNMVCFSRMLVQDSKERCFSSAEDLWKTQVHPS
jgi:hypothetical protein